MLYNATGLFVFVSLLLQLFWFILLFDLQLCLVGVYLFVVLGFGVLCLIRVGNSSYLSYYGRLKLLLNDLC